MIIIGIDPGYDRLGVAVIEKDTHSKKERHLYSDCLQTLSTDCFEDRLLSIGKQLETIIEKFNPSEVALESLYFNTNQKTAINVAGVRGIILYIAKKYKINTTEYTPIQIKSAVGGSGRASKKEVEMMIQNLLTLPKKKRLDDEYDAIAVALTHSACIR